MNNNRTFYAVKTFCSNNKFFLYSAYRNSIQELTKKQFANIRRLEETCPDQDFSPDILGLKDVEVPVFPIFKKLEHPITANYECIINRRISKVIFQVTEQCNFRCRYCHNVQPGSTSLTNGTSNMSWNIAKMGADYVINHSQDAETINVYFYGGEPLLNFSLIKDLVHYFSRRILLKKVVYRVTTNLSILTDEIVNFLYNHDFMIAVSLDGNESIQNKHRRFNDGAPSFSIVWNNVLKLRNVYGEKFNSNIIFLPVVFPDELQKEVEEFYALNNIMRENLFFQKANTAGVDYSVSVSPGYRDVSLNNNENFIDSTDKAEMEKSVYDIYKKKTRIPQVWHHSGPCCVGAYKLFISTIGEFYPCERVPQYDAICFGNVYEGVNLEKAKELINLGSLTKEECSSCWAMRFCKICIAQCIDEEKKCLSKDVKMLNCSFQKKRILSILKKIADKEMQCM